RNTGLQSLFIHDVLVDQVSHFTVYAATDSGVFKSTNGGASWTKASIGLPSFATGHDARVLAQDPVHPNVLFCALYGGGVFQSFNAAGTWIPLEMQSGLTNLYVRSLAVDGASVIVYAGTDGGVEQLANYPLTGTAVGESPTDRVLSFAAWPNPAHGVVR